MEGGQDQISERTLFSPKQSLLSTEGVIPQCYLCGYEREDGARYCAVCGANLDDSATGMTSPEWANTEEFLDLGKALSATLDIHLLLKKIDDSAVRLTGATAGSIMLFDEERTSLRFRSSSGEKAAAVQLLPVKDGIAWWVGTCGMPARVNDASKDGRFTGAIDNITGFETKSILCVPVMLADEIIGVIEVLNKSDGTGFSARDEELLSVLTGQAAVAVENARFATEQQNFFNHVIEILVEAVESTLLVPEGHCWRVAKLSTAIGRRMEMKDQALEDLYYAAALHDLGMLKLVEGGSKRSHPTLGANMVRGIAMLKGTEFTIRHHHEYFDGSGYPDGLADKELPLSARIISTVEAYEESILESGSQLMAEVYVHERAAQLFDMAVVDAFLEMVTLAQ